MWLSKNSENNSCAARRGVKEDRLAIFLEIEETQFRQPQIVDATPKNYLIRVRAAISGAIDCSNQEFGEIE